VTRGNEIRGNVTRGNEIRANVTRVNEINVFQLISQGYSKIQLFQKKFLLGSIGSSW
jgi:hypothetical protein